MENLFNMEGLEVVSLDYKNKPCDNLELEIIDAFYIYEYIIKQMLPEIIKDHKNNTELTFNYSSYINGHTEVPTFNVHWLDYHNKTSINLFLINDFDPLRKIYGYRPNPYISKNENLKINKATFDILIQMFKNFIDHYELGGKYIKSDECIEFSIEAPLYQLIDAYYNEWQRIDYEAKEIIEDLQEEYDIDRKVLLPGETDINALRRKKCNLSFFLLIVYN